MNRLRPDADDARFIRRIVLILLILGIAAALFRAGDLLILAFGSILGAIVIHAIADLYADHLPLGPRRSLTLSIATVLAVLGFLAWLFGVAFRQQLNTLVTQLPILLDQLAGWASQSPVGEKIVDAVRVAYAGSRVAQDISGIVSGAGEFILNCPFAAGRRAVLRRRSQGL